MTAVVEAAVHRTRPVALTAAATVLAMVPLTRSVFWGPMAIAIMEQLAENERTVTVDLTIHYLRPISEGTAKASARVVRAGRRVITVSAELFDHGGKLSATAISTYLRM